jgi:hypothetical protein
VAGIAPRPTNRPCFLASLGGEVPPNKARDARHWRHVSDTIFLYGEAADAALAMRPAAIAEIGATAHTAPYLAAAARRRGGTPRIVKTMAPGEPELATWERARDRLGRTLTR